MWAISVFAMHTTVSLHSNIHYFPSTLHVCPPSSPTLFKRVKSLCSSYSIFVINGLLNMIHGKSNRADKFSKVFFIF